MPGRFHSESFFVNNYLSLNSTYIGKLRWLEWRENRVHSTINYYCTEERANFFFLHGTAWKGFCCDVTNFYFTFWLHFFRIHTAFNNRRTPMYKLIVHSYNIVNSSHIVHNTPTLSFRVKDANWPPRHRFRSVYGVCTYIPWSFRTTSSGGALLRRCGRIGIRLCSTRSPFGLFIIIIRIQLGTFCFI